MAAAGGKLVLFGGHDGAHYLNDTWTWNGSAWSQQNVAGPSKREIAAMATLGDKAVLFGGDDGTSSPPADTLFGGTNGHSQVYDDTWTWNGTSWKQESATGPSVRFSAPMTSL